MPDGTPVDRFFAAFEDARAARPGALRETSLLVGGRTVGVRVVGERLAAFVPRAFAPGDPAAVPELTLDLWDEEATGVGDPSGGRPNAVLTHGRVGGEMLATSLDGRRVRYCGPEFDLRLQRDERRAAGWVSSVDRLGSWNPARPLQGVFMPWLTDLGMITVHAALVARDGDGVVLVGRSMAGKSTTAGACAEHGLQVVGDDAIAVERRADGGYDGHCVHATIKLRRAGLHRTPALAEHAVPMSGPWADEAVLYLRESRPDAVAATARIRALAFPRLGDAPVSRVAPISRGRALATLTGAAHSVEQGGIGATFALVSELAEELPAFGVEVGTDTATIPAAVAELLERAAVV